MQGSDLFSKNQGRCNLRLGFPYQNSGCKISLLGRHSSLTKFIVFSTNFLIIMKGAYSKVFTHFFLKINELKFLKQEVKNHDTRVQNKQKNLNQYNNLKVPIKHKSKTCNKLGCNTTETEKTTQEQK